MSQAWALYDELQSDERVCFLQEPQRLEPAWRRHTEGHTHSPKVWSDAYLSAFADAAGIGVVSFDQGFRKFHGVELTIPE